MVFDLCCYVPKILALLFASSAGNCRSWPENLSPENVHKFRTSSRRVEVLVSDLAEQRSGNDKKLLKLLARLRKKAGRVRDLDVQSAALRSLKIPQEPGRKSQLMRTLAEERSQREKSWPSPWTRKLSPKSANA